MNYKFTNRSKDSEKLLIILSGYKPDLWDKVFDRINKYTPNDFDVCVVTSGLENEQLKEIARQHCWSYLSTDINNLCYAQNVCISAHPKAEFIFKIDEDMFLTDETLNQMLFTYTHCLDLDVYVPSAVVPMINVNCTTYIDFLRRENLCQEFSDRFGKIKITNGLHHNQHILNNSEIAKFLWSNVNIDDFNSDLKHYSYYPVEYDVCATRFSIGLVMFPRSTWIEMGNFPVLLESDKDYERKGLGVDERELCKFAMSKAKPILIDRLSAVGHLAYGPQTKEMIQFFKERPELF